MTYNAPTNFGKHYMSNIACVKAYISCVKAYDTKKCQSFNMLK